MFNSVQPGKNAPEEINVIIEIPAHSEPVKYEVDKETGTMVVDRFMLTSMRYPCEYGYIPNTLGKDGDPVDVLVISPLPLITGAVITTRPIGVLLMEDESGEDNKILAVPVNSLTPLYKNVHKPEDLFPLTLERISHFFEHYKDLEKTKWVKIHGWEGAESAKKIILESIEDFKKS